MEILHFRVSNEIQLHLQNYFTIPV